jgi:hypothetical protein
MNQKLADILEVLNDTSKTCVMAILLLLATAFRIKGYVDSDGFVNLIRTTTIAYFSTSTAVHFVSMVKDSVASKLQTTVPKDTVHEV